MKHLFLFSLMLFSSLAQAADPAVKLQDKCDTKEAKRLMGRNGSCRVVVAPKNLTGQGYCSGVFENRITCTITYDGQGSTNTSMLTLDCGTATETVLYEDMVVEAIDYDVATIISGNGRTSIIEDANRYRQLSNKSIEMSFIKGRGPVKGDVIIHLSDVSVPLTDVICE